MYYVSTVIKQTEEHTATSVTFKQFIQTDNRLEFRLSKTYKELKKNSNNVKSNYCVVEKLIDVTF